LLSLERQKRVLEMADESQKSALIVSRKKGVPVYATNPSVPTTGEIGRRKRVQFGNEKRGFVVDNGSGEVLAFGGMGFYEFEEVDSTRFVKMFLAGIKQAAGLSKAGLSVFELVYREVQEHPGIDEVKLSYAVAAERIAGLNERTYQRGLRELLDREFLFRSRFDGVFFVNIRYMFNGDRLAFVKGYKLKGQAEQTELPLEDPPSITLPSSA
jgi:hypothetical protein